MRQRNYSKDSVFKAPLLSFTVENYYAALKRFKIYDSTAVDPSDDEDETD